MSETNDKSLLEKAQEVPTRGSRRPVYSEEHYELAVALLRGKIRPAQFSVVFGGRNAVLDAWKILVDGVAREMILVEVVE